MTSTPIPSSGHHPSSTVLFKALERYLRDHPIVSKTAFYVLTNRAEHPHNYNQVGYYRMQVRSSNRPNGQLTNATATVQIQFTAFHIDAVKAERILEVIAAAVELCPTQLQMSEAHYVTCVQRSSISIPTVFQRGMGMNSASMYYDFALKREH